MEKKLKKVQRGAAVGFVLLKILRIVLIIAAVALIAGLVVLAVVDENDLPLDAVKDGKLIIDMRDLDLSQLGLDKVPNIGGLIQNGVLTLDLRDAKLAVLMLIGVGVLILAAVYVLLLVAGKIFKHMKAEDTPFTAGNVRRLRMLGILLLVFWACGIALGYFVGSELIRRLALPANKVTLSLDLSTILVALLFFFLARLFSFGKAQGEALQAAVPAPEPAPAPAPLPEPEPIAPVPVTPVPEATATPEPAPAVEPIVEPIEEPAVEPAVEEAPVSEESAEPVQPEE